MKPDGLLRPRSLDPLQRSPEKDRYRQFDCRCTEVKRAKDRKDDLGIEVAGRLEGIHDLVAEEILYHVRCRASFERDGHYSKNKDVNDPFLFWYFKSIISAGLE